MHLTPDCGVKERFKSTSRHRLRNADYRVRLVFVLVSKRMPETAPPLEVVARAVGALVGRFPVLFVVAVAATCLGAASGLLSKDFVDKELFESLILRRDARRLSPLC